MMMDYLNIKHKHNEKLLCVVSLRLSSKAISFQHQICVTRICEQGRRYVYKIEPRNLRNFMAFY